MSARASSPSRIMQAKEECGPVSIAGSCLYACHIPHPYHMHTTKPASLQYILTGRVSCFLSLTLSTTRDSGANPIPVPAQPPTLWVLHFAFPAGTVQSHLVSSFPPSQSSGPVDVGVSGWGGGRGENHHESHPILSCPVRSWLFARMHPRAAGLLLR